MAQLVHGPKLDGNKDTFVGELRCPRCVGGRFSFKAESNAGSEDSIQCQSCGVVFPVIDGIIHFALSREKHCGIDYALDDWRERERKREKGYERDHGFSHDWLRSLPYPEIETETTFQKKGGGLGRNFEDIISRIGLTGSERVFDMAVGSCWTSREFAKRGCGVVCTDYRTIKYHGLRSAEAYFEAGIPRFERLCWSFGKIPFPDETFDLVFCQNAYQYVPDLAAMTKEVHRVLKPNGKFVLAWTGPRAPFKRNSWGPGHYVTAYLHHARKCGFGVEVFPPYTLYDDLALVARGCEKQFVPTKIFSAMWKLPFFRRLYLRYISYPVSVLFGVPFNMIALK